MGKQVRLRRYLNSKPKLTIVLAGLSFALVSSLGFAQSMFFHLLASNDPTANFTTTSQTVNEASGTYATWPNALSAWSNRRRIIFEGSSSGDVLDFPALVKLNASRINYASIQAGGRDVRFADDQGNLLPYEIENWDPSGDSFVWVKLSKYKAAPNRTSFWIYYGNATAADAQTPATLWSPTQNKVFHFTGTSGTTIGNTAAIKAAIGTDGTANNGGSGMGFVASPTGTGITFDGVNDWIDVGGDTNLNFAAGAPLTMSAMLKTTDDSGPLIMFRDTVGGNTVLGIYVGQNGADFNSGKVNILIRDSQSSSGFAELVGPTVNDGNWHDIAITRNAGNVISLFVDGIGYGTTSGSGSGGPFNGDLRAIGSDRLWVSVSANSANDQYLSGTIDEVRISGTQLNGDYFLAKYQTALDLTSHYGAEENATIGLVPLIVGLGTPATTNVTVPYTVTGTATSLVDHTGASGSITIATGQSTGSIPVRILRDNIVESDETAIFTLGTPTGAGLGTQTVHTITITDEVEAAPDAVDDTISISSMSPVMLPVLSNDTDSNGDLLTITSFTNPAKGTLAKVGTNLVYTPSDDFSATDTFTYTISDGRGGTDTATVNLNFAIPFTWLGAGSDQNWATAANWSGGVTPAASDTVYFNDQCGANCTPVITNPVAVAGLRLNTSYTGIVAQGANAINLSSTGFKLRGGTFSATTGQLKLVTGDFIVKSTGTFNAGTGTLYHLCAFQARCVIEPGTGNYYNVTIEGNQSLYDVSSMTMNVNGTLSMGDTAGASYTSQHVDNGTFFLKGNYVVTNNGVRGNSYVRMAGNGAGQTITGLAGKFLPNLTIDAGANTVTFSGDVGVSNTYKYISGTIVTTGSTLRVFCDYGLECTFETGTQNYNNITLASDLGNYNLVGQTVNVLGTLSMGDTHGAGFVTQHVRNGTINARGAINLPNQGYIGDVVINSRGADTTLAVGSPAGVPEGTFTVNKTLPTLKLSLTTNANFAGSGQALNVTRGIVDLAGHNLGVAGLLTVSPAGKVICNGGIVTAGSTSILGEVDCGSSIGITWTGNSTDGLWTTASNWSSGVVPGGSDVALFNSICGSNCNVSIPANLSVRGITMTSSYTGTITQAPSATLTVGAGGWNQYGGTFVGSNAAVNLTDHFALAGGTYTATSASTTIGQQECGTKEILTITGGTFNHGNGRMVIKEGRPNSGSCHSMPQLNFPSGFTVYDLEFNAIATSGGWISTIQATNYSTISVANQFYDYGHESKLNLDVTGDIFLENTNNSYGATYPSGVIRLVGAGNQVYTTTATATSGILKIDKTSGTVTPNASTTNLRVFALELAQGSFTAPSGTVTLGKDIFASVTMDSLKVASGTTFNLNGATMAFALRRDPGASANVTGNINVPAAFNFGNVELVGAVPAGGWYDFITSNNDLTVLGNLVFNGHVNQANWKVAGNLTVTGASYGGAGIITLNGSTNQSITGTLGAYLSKLVINSSGGKVSLSGVICSFNDFTYTSGVVDAGASEVRFDSSYRSISLSPGSMSFHDLNLHGYVGTLNITGTVDVLGKTVITGDSVSPYYDLEGGTIKAHGDVNVTSAGAVGTTLIQLAGSSNQILSGADSAIPAIEINSTGGTVTLSGTLRVQAGYTQTQGTVDAGTSLLKFNGGNGTYTMTGGATNFNDVQFAGYVSTYTVSGTFKVGGTLTLNSASASPPQQINSGALAASGNVVFSGFGGQGTSPLQMLGATATTLTISSGATRIYGTVSIAKTSGATVALAQDSNFDASGQDLTVSSGVLDLAGYNLAVNDVLTVASGATLRCNDGTFTSGSVVNSGTIECIGYVDYPFNWTGATGDGKWSTAGNWTGGVVPSSSNTPAFQDTFCSSHCDANIDLNASMKGLVLRSPYTGVLRQNAGFTVSVGSRGWLQGAGTFTGGDSNVTVIGPFSLSGGTFNATSATSSFQGNFTVSGAPTFAHGNGLMTFDNSQTLIPNAITANNVRFGGTNPQNLSGGILNVAGNLELSDSNVCCTSALNSGTVNVNGNVTVTNFGKPGSAVIRLNGSGNQSITSNVNGRVPGLQFASTGGTITLTNNIFVDSTFNFVSGSINSSASTVIFQNTQTLTPNGVSLANVKFAGTSPQNLGGQTLTVSTLLTIDDPNACCTSAINNGTLNATGNVVITGYGKGGTATLKIAGSTNQSVTGATTTRLPKFEIASTGGTVALVNRLNFMNDYKWTSGTVDTTGGMLIFGQTQTITPGSVSYDAVTFSQTAPQDLNGGTLIVKNLTIDDPNACCTSAINNGTLSILGNVTVTGFGKAGSANLLWSGALDGTITQASGARLPTGTHTVNKTAGTVTQASNVVFAGTNAFTIAAGSWNMAGYNLTTTPGGVSNAGTLQRGTSPSCGTITSGSYSGTPAVCP